MLRRLFIVVGSLLLAGCCQIQPTFHLSNDVSMEVLETEVSEDSFDLKIEFKEETPHGYLVQQGTVEAGDLVECWKTRNCGTIKGHDHQWASGIQAPTLRRDFVVYAATVEGADLTERQHFAILPASMDGSVQTTVDPKTFNYENYFAKGHKIQGRIVDRAQVTGTWSLIWTPNQIRIETENGFAVYSNGAFLVVDTE